MVQSFQISWFLTILSKHLLSFLWMCASVTCTYEVKTQTQVNNLDKQWRMMCFCESIKGCFFFWNLKWRGMKQFTNHHHIISKLPINEHEICCWMCHNSWMDKKWKEMYVLNKMTRASMKETQKKKNREDFWDGLFVFRNRQVYLFSWFAKANRMRKHIF